MERKEAKKGNVVTNSSELGEVNIHRVGMNGCHHDGHGHEILFKRRALDMFRYIL